MEFKIKNKQIIQKLNLKEIMILVKAWIVNNFIKNKTEYMTMRVMKAFEIEASYQKHRERLTSIQGFNTKKKVMSTASKNIEKINNFKKHRLTAEIFTEKQKMDQRSKNNVLLQKNLTKVYNRDPHAIPSSTFNIRNQDKSIKRLNSKSSLKSINSSSSRIQEENKKMGQKIAGMKSTYTKFRETSQSVNRKHYGSNTDKNKQQLVRLLQMQLGKKPTVLFPSVKKRKPENTITNDDKSKASKKRFNSSSSFSKLHKSGSLKSVGNLTSKTKV